jgi:hypothetical protein
VNGKINAKNKQIRKSIDILPSYQQISIANSSHQGWIGFAGLLLGR